MATAVLTIVGSMIPGYGTVGAIVGGIVGSYIDSELFAADDDTPIAESYEHTSAVEGGPALSCIGQAAKVKGQLVFLSPNFTHHDQAANDLAIVVANDGTVIGAIDKVYADGFEIYTRSGKLTQTTKEIKLTQTPTNPIAVNPVARFAVDGMGWLDSSPQKGANLGKFRVANGYNLSITGFSNSYNNLGSVTRYGGNLGSVMKISQLPDGKIRMNFRLVFQSWLIDGPLTTEDSAGSYSVTLTQSVTPINSVFASAIEVFTGAAGQSLPATGGLNRHVNNAAQMERSAGFVLRDFKKTQFGSRVPEIVAIVRQSGDTPVTLPAAIDSIFEKANWTSGTWDTSALDASRIVKGYSMREELSIQQRLQALFYAFDFFPQERDGVIHFIHTEDARVFSIAESAFVSIEFHDKAKIDLPTKVAVHFTDENQDYEAGSVERHVGGQNQSTKADLEIDLNRLSMSTVDATEIGDRLLWRPHREGRRFTAELPARCWYLLENDIIDTTYDGDAKQLWITKADRGHDRTIKVEGYEYLPDPVRSSV